jgi:hypothetical protein
MNSLVGITGGQNPNRMTAAGCALWAALLMPDRAVKQGATQDIGEFGKTLKNPFYLGLRCLLHY